MKKKIYLIDLTHESKLGIGSDTMPLQLGLIGAYCLKEHGDKIEIQIFKFIKDLENEIKKKPPFIIAASNYLWNIDLGYKIVNIIKEKHPKTIIVFGGPNYPDEPEEQVKWLRRYPSIDFYIFKDGEVPFSRLVSFLLENPDVIAAKKAKLSSCHALIDGQPYFGSLEPRLEDLSQIPSPYLTGLMDKFFDKKLIPPIQTNRGCPFTCSYCTEGDPYYSKVCKTSFDRKKAEVDYIAKNIKHTKTLRITDSNFGMFEEDVEFCKYLGEVRKRTGYPEYLTCSTGKNQKDKILKCNELLGNIMRFTASVQSLNAQVLKNIKRTNISPEEIMALSDQVSDTDTHSYSEIILALPGDSLEAEKESMAGLIRAGISNITQHQLSIIYSTELASSRARHEFGMKSMFRPIQRCVGIYSFDGKVFPAIEIEEICVANNTLSYDDYLEARRLYLSVGLFYNDRIFGEIHALLRLLHLSTWEWLLLIHEDIKNNELSGIKKLYDGFIDDTKKELWDTKEDLIRDVSASIEKYASGEAGGNLIYKYRSQAIVKYFSELHKIAFLHLRRYLLLKGIKQEEVVNEIEQFARYQKADLFDINIEKEDDFHYDILKMIKDPSLARSGGNLEDIHYNVRFKIAHTPEQKEMIQRQLNFYGTDIGGLTMLISRFPIKRFYRVAEKIE